MDRAIRQLEQSIRKVDTSRGQHGGKACDELEFGNREFDHVKERLERMLATYIESMPEVEFFLDTFKDKCLVSVDELSE